MKVSMLFALVVASLLGGCGEVVGARCAPGFALCEGRCAPLGTCAACEGASCTGDDGGVARGELDAGELDAGETVGDGGMTADAEMHDGGMSPDARGPDDAGTTVPSDGRAGGDAGSANLDGGGPPACDVGEIACDGTCVPAYDDPRHCGACDVVCALGEVCHEGDCIVVCPPPSQLCAGRCVDLDRDPDHCGACGNACVSGICVDGMCSDPLAGHVVAIGHDYSVGRLGMNRLAGNAVFLARARTVRVVAWTGDVAAASRSGVENAVDQVSVALGRPWEQIVVNDAEDVPLHLAGADVLIVHAQASGDDASLVRIGTSWRRALETFLLRGGVVVAFEAPAESHAGTFQILVAAGVLRIEARTQLTDPTVVLDAPADAVALGVPLSYHGETSTVYFTTTEPGVVASVPEGAVVLHRTIRP